MKTFWLVCIALSGILPLWICVALLYDCRKLLQAAEEEDRVDAADYYQQLSRTSQSDCESRMYGTWPEEPEERYRFPHEPCGRAQSYADKPVIRKPPSFSVDTPPDNVTSIDEVKKDD